MSNSYRDLNVWLEGKGRSDRDFSRFLLQARGSVWEAETQVEIALRLKYLKAAEAQELLAAASEISRMLNGMLNALSRDNRNPQNTGIDAQG